jgi:putative FmdB family regulatory protein
MPLYEYECLSCGKRTEVLQRMDEAPLAACPECGHQVRKLVSTPAFQFKGSGWYVTDYAGKKGGGPESQPESKGEDAGKTGKTEKTDKTEKVDKKETAGDSKGSSGGSTGGSE